MHRTAVYIGKDIEMVRTGKYEMLFRRFPTGDLYLEVLLSDISGEEKRLLGICQANADATVVSYAIHEQLQNCEILLSRIGKRPDFIEEDAGSHKSITFSDASVYSLNLVEELTGTSRPVKPSLRDAPVHRCLCDWQKGTKIIKDNEILSAVIINTNQHMYIFELWQNTSVYIRAARHNCTDRGMVFAQNTYIRAGQYNQVFMLEDNREAAKEITVNPDHFSLDSCFIPPNVSDGIYWTLQSPNTDQEEIILDGCHGKNYYFRREEAGFDEYFE